MDATTIRASTVTRSMPTRETRTHASMTMPLSSTRSRTSMSELPLGVLSTAMEERVRGELDVHREEIGAPHPLAPFLFRESFQGPFDPIEPLLELSGLQGSSA